MLTRLERLATLFLLVAAIVLLPPQIVETFGSKRLAMGVALAFSLLLGLSALHYLFPHPYHFRFGVRRFTARALVPRRLVRVAIDESYRATVSTWRQYLWLAEPPDEEFVDLIDVPAGSDMPERLYHSADSVPAEIVRKSPHTLAVFWRPHERPEPLVPYIHHVRYVSASLYGDDAFWQAFHVDRETGVAKFVFRSHHPMEHVVAFVLPPFLSAINIARVYKHASGRRPRRCPQPQLAPGGRAASWTLTRPKLGRTYVLVGFYVGGQRTFESYAPSHLLTRRVLAKLKRLTRVVRKDAA